MKKAYNNDLENKYHAIIEQAMDALVVHDFKGRFIEVNQRTCDVLGYTKEELLKMSVTDIEQDFDLKRAQTEWDKVKENEYLTVSGHHKKKDGTVFPVEIKVGIFILSGKKYYFGLARDITVQKAAEEKIRSEEKKYRTTLDNILEGCQIIDFDWRYIYINDSADKHNRRPKQELLGKKYADMWPGIEKTEVYARIKRCLEERISYQFENEFIFPDGSPGWFELSIQPVPEGVFILSYDITSRKRAEKALQENEQRLRFALEGANDGIWDVQMKSGKVYLSPRGCEILGYTFEEFPQIEKNWEDLVNPDDMPKTHLSLENHITGKSGLFEVEQRLRTKSGGWKWVLTRGKVVERDSKGNPRRMTGTHTDISEQKAAEEALHESRERFYSLFENSFDAIMMTVKDGTVLSANPAACRLFQRTEEEICKLGRNGLVDVSDKRLDNFLEERDHFGRAKGELTFIGKDGIKFEGEITSSVFEDKYGFERTSIIIRDISERKKNEDVLIQNEKKYRYLFDNNPLPMWIYDLETLQFLEVNESAISHYGYTREEFLKMTLKDIRPEEDVKRLLKDVEDTKDVLNFAGSWRHRLKNGNIIFVEIVSHLIDFENRPARLVLANNITEKIQTQEELKESEEKYRTLIEIFYDAVFINQNNKIVYVNNSARKLFGAENDDDLIGKSPFEFFHPDFHPLMKQRIGILLDGKTGVSAAEEKIVRLDGKVVDVEVTATMFILKGQKAVQVVLRDITERKRSEAVLKKLTERFNLATDAAKIGVWDWDIRGDKLIWDNRMYELYGIDKEIFPEAYNAWLNGIHPDDRESSNEVSQKALKGDIEYDTEFRVMWPDGSVHWLKANGQVFRDDEGNPVRMVGINYDITDQINAKEQLSESLERFSTIVRTSPQAIIITGPAGEIILWNESAERIFGWKQEEIMGKPTPIVSQENIDEVRRVRSQIMSGKTILNWETYGKRKDDSKIYLNYSATPYYNSKGEIVGVLSIAEDTTERKHAHEALETSEKLYRSLFTNMLNGFAYCRMLYDEKGSPFDFTYLAVNDAFETLTGLKNVTGRKVSDVIPGIQETDAELINIYGRVAKGGKPEVFEVFVEALQMWFSISVYCPAVDYFVAIFDVITERKNAEKALMVNEERFRHVSDCSGVWIWETDKDGTYTYVSPMEENILGYKVDELIGKKHFYDFFIPEVKKELKAAALGVFERKEQFKNFENANIHKDGYVVYLETSGLPMLDEHGNLLGYRGADRDITPQRLAVEALKESESSLREAQNLAKIGNWEYNPENGNLIMSQECFNIFELDDNLHAASLFNIVMDMVHPEERETLDNLINNAIKTGKGYNYEHRLILPDRKIKYIFGVGEAIKNSQGKVISLRGIIQDITERKKSEEKLNEALYRFETIIRTSPQAIIVTDNESNIMLWNDSAEMIFGWSADEVTGKANPIIPGDMLGEVQKVKERVLKGNTVKGIETRRLCKNGNLIDVSFSATPYRDGHGNITGILAIVEDITERKKAEQEIKKFNEELEQRVIERTSQLEEANKELEAFSYSVSHDLRAPLRAISGFSKIITEDYSSKLDNEGKEYLNDIISNSVKMSKLIDDLLELSRFGRKQITKTHINMKELFAEVSKEENSLLDKKAKIKISKLHDAYGDFNLIKQVIVNLISNALKYSSKKADALISVSSEISGNDVIYCVKDNGVGFNMAYAHKLFGVFQRLHGVEEFDGTGVGLAIVQRVILRHNGKVWAESDEGKGAAFYFSLPLN